MKTVTELNKLERKARKMALAWLNENRARDGKPLIRRLEPQWWRMYSEEWVQKALEAERIARESEREERLYLAARKQYDAP